MGLGSSPVLDGSWSDRAKLSELAQGFGISGESTGSIRLPFLAIFGWRSPLSFPVPIRWIDSGLIVVPFGSDS